MSTTVATHIPGAHAGVERCASQASRERRDVVDTSSDSGSEGDGSPVKLVKLKTGGADTRRRQAAARLRATRTRKLYIAAAFLVISHINDQEHE